MWNSYLAVNQAVASVLASLPAPAILVNDYHFFMVPLFLDKPTLQRTTLFIHTSFPDPAEVAALRWMVDILRSLVRCKALGFQTVRYLESFERCLAHWGIDHGECTLFVNPVRVSPWEWATLSTKVDAVGINAALKRALYADRIILGVDRIDPIKGLDLKLEALGRMLESNVGRGTRSVLLQVIVASRDQLAPYRSVRDALQRNASEVNEKYGTHVVYLQGPLNRVELALLYGGSDMLAVTSRREGMNLVSQEYLACRSDVRRALVLSRYTGLSYEFRELGASNPHNCEELALQLADRWGPSLSIGNMGDALERLRDQSRVPWIERMGQVLLQ
jgi:trehalose 6-phosphate synthase